MRELRESDFDVLGQILGEMWYGDYGELAPLLGTAEFLEHLSHSDAGFVAEDDDGGVLGVVLVGQRGSEGNYELRSAAQKRLEGVRAELPEQDLLVVTAVLEAEDALVERVAQELGEAGEIVLLIVSSAARGQGLGKKLYRVGTQWLIDHGSRYVRLATDETCDWQVYEHLGMERVAKDCIPEDSSSVELFVYQADSEALLKRLSLGEGSL